MDFITNQILKNPPVLLGLIAMIGLLYKENQLLKSLKER